MSAPPIPPAKFASSGLTFGELDVGARFLSYGRTVTEADIVAFCCLVGYHAPLFIDEEFAKTTAFGGRIAPSSLVMSISTAMTESLFRTTVVALKGVDRGQFHAPVRPGDTIRTETEVLSKRETAKPDRGLVVFRDRVFNQHDALVFEIDKTALIQRRA
jgi:acyl dehydratase